MHKDKQLPTIFEAARTADIKTIKDHIHFGTDVNEPELTSSLGSALYQAIHSLNKLDQHRSSTQHLGAIALLVSAGALLFSNNTESNVRVECSVITQVSLREPVLFAILQYAKINPFTLLPALVTFSFLGHVNFVKLLLLERDAKISDKAFYASLKPYTGCSLHEQQPHTILSKTIHQLFLDKEPAPLSIKTKSLSPQRRQDYLEIIKLLIANGALYFYDDTSDYFIKNSQKKPKP